MIQISQVYANDSNSLKFIERIYTESFPPDERRDFSDVIRLLEEDLSLECRRASKERTVQG